MISLKLPSRVRLLMLILAFAIIGVSFLLIIQYERGIAELANKWWPSINIRSGSNTFVGRHQPIIENKPLDLKRYNIKASFVVIDLSGGSLEIAFCDKYSLFLASGRRPGVYHQVDNGAKEYVSKVDYRKVILRSQSNFTRLHNFNILLQCDLIEKTASVYIAGKFLEKIYLGPEPVHYNAEFFISSKEAVLGKLEISDGDGKILFSADHARLFFYKLIAQILFFLGIFIFFALACPGGRFFRMASYLIIILLFAEAFLRIAEKYNFCILHFLKIRR